VFPNMGIVYLSTGKEADSKKRNNSFVMCVKY
jgi:hypothetical protein